MNAVVNDTADASAGRLESCSPLCESSRRALQETTISWIHHQAFDDTDQVHSLLETLREEDRSESANSDVMSGRDFVLPDRALLKPADEASLFLKFNLLKCLAERRRQHALGPSGTKTDERTVYNLLAEADQIRNQIMEANQRLVVSIASRFTNAACPLSDMISEGNLTLLKAINCFDAGRGFRFSTYATYAIRRHLGRLQQREKKRAMVSGEDLPDPVTEEGFPEWLDVHPGEFVQRVISELPERERNIMSMRFGIQDEGKISTYAEIAHVYGISKERVRQLIVKSCQAAFQRYGKSLGYA